MYETSYMQLLRENSELQRSYTLLLSSSASKGGSPVPNPNKSGAGSGCPDDSPSPELNRLREDLAIAEKTVEELESSLSNRVGVPGRLIKDKKLLIRSNYVLAEKYKTLQEKESKVKIDLQDAKDQCELLEFRVLELEEEKGRSQLKSLKTSKEVDSINKSLGCDSGTSSITNDEDLLEIHNDFRKEKVSTTKSRLQALVETTPQANDKSLLLQTVALFESLLSKIQDLQKENEQLKKSGNRFDDIVLDLEDSRRKLEDALQDAANLKKENETLNQKMVQLQEDKLQNESTADSRISELEKRLEIKEEMDVVSRGDEVDHELCFTKVSAHLRRNKNGACSSSSGISSDISDNENEHTKPSNKEIFTESGIFVDEEQHQSVSTQTLDANKSRNEDSRSDYESSEELEDLKEECRDLVNRKKELEYELERYKEEIKTLKTKEDEECTSDQKITELGRIEFSLRNQLGEWEKKYRSLYQQNQMLMEEKCEFEEADNDSRLNAQRWEQDYKLSYEKTLILSDELTLERKAMTRLKAEFEELQRSVEDSRSDSAYLEALVNRYEQRIFDLEELEVELREKLTLLESAFNVLSWWTRVTMSLGTRLISAPMLLHLPSGHEDEKEVEAMSCRVESCLKVRELAERLFFGQEENAKRIIELEGKLDSSESNLRSHSVELEELKAKELAYEETMARAETILRDIESNYRNKIAIVEEEKKSLEYKLECKSKSSSLQSRLALSDEMEVELKDRILRLEETEKELNAKLNEQRRLNSTLRKEMMEREEDLTHRLTDMRAENDKISNTLRKRISDIERDSLDVRRKLSEAEQESEERYTKICRMENEISRLLLLSPRNDHLLLRENNNTLRIRVRGFEKPQSSPSICSRDSVLDSSDEYFSIYRNELSELQKDLITSNQRINESDKAIDKLKEEMGDVRGQLLGLKSSIKSHQISPSSCSPDSSSKESNNALSAYEESNQVCNGDGGLVSITRDVESVTQLLENCINCQRGPVQILKNSAAALRNMSSIICGEQQFPYLDKLNSYESDETLVCASVVDGVSIDKTLQNHLGELKEKLIKMENELNLVGEESKDLHEQLLVSKTTVELKEKEIESGKERVKELETENHVLSEGFEKQSAKVESLNYRFRETLDSKRQLEHKCEVKDFLIKTLAECSACSTNNNTLRPSALINRLKETTFKPSYKGMDFNLDSLCHYLGTFRGRDKSEHHQSIHETQSLTNETLIVSSDIRIASKIDSTTLLISWTPPNKDLCIKAYLVYISGTFHQKINEFWLGKALIHGLKLHTNFILDIVCTGKCNNNLDKKCRQRGQSIQEVVNSQLQSFLGGKKYLPRNQDPYLPSLIEHQRQLSAISLLNEDMERRKKSSILSSGPITSSAVDYSRLRLRSAKPRCKKGIPFQKESGGGNTATDNKEIKSISSEVHFKNSLSFDNWFNSNEINGTSLDTDNSNSQIQVVEPSDNEDITNKNNSIEIRDIEDSIESNLFINKEFTTPMGVKPRGTPFTLDLARSLRHFLFKSTSCQFSSGWFNQGFEFNTPGTNLSFGLKQRKGGPCGIIATVQAYILKFLLFDRDEMSTLVLKTVINQREALLEAFCSIFKKIAGNNDIIIVTPGCKFHFQGIGNYYKSDGVTEKLETHTFKQSSLKEVIKLHLNSFFDHEMGVICFLYSIILTKGIDNIMKEMDTTDSPFVGAHGYCTQEMVNLLLTGSATSNAFDGSMSISDGILLRGITCESELGFLSLFEHYGSCAVGQHYKNPKYPIWIVCSESHFSVLFSLENPVNCDLYYYDELAKQELPIKISLSYNGNEGTSSPIEKCIRTKWKNVSIDWNGTEPIL
ncbi:MINDY3_4 [Lepeophtheirus salmonis]|uniref:Ubiquitin carboxyl-terminal hydrolase MINDY n=1 Tax=Lepeophtheirus salmonis TaxID=72036 RepID=A0A7R8CKP8_LEPSM|nr:MINDY3_4 [Lepeophtheirus salmonis]CAF2849414.1 MINDY3_4 [Lepeophtheirus salmonis]